MNNLYVNENTQINETAGQTGVTYDDICSLHDLLAHEAAVSRETMEEEELRLASRAKAKLILLVSRYSFMLDTCALLHANCALLLEHLVPLLQESGKQLLIPFCVVLELQRLAERHGSGQERAERMIQTLLELKRSGLVSICGDVTELKGDKQKVATVIQQMKECEVLFVTQNRRLSQVLIEVSRMGLAGGNIGVGIINSHGYVSRFRVHNKGLVPGVRYDGAKVWEHRTCADCGEQFVIFDRERDHCLETDTELPQSCPLCRKLKKISWNGMSVAVAV